jgi:rsbT co-antagonist protein RsbR
MEGLEAIVQRMTVITGRLAEARDVASLATAVHDLVEGFLPVEQSGFYFIDPETGELRLLRSKGLTEDERLDAERAALDSDPGWVLRTGQVLDVPDVPSDSEQRSRSSKSGIVIRSHLYVPVVCEGRCVGTLGCLSSTPNGFTGLGRAVLQLAATSAGFTYKKIIDTGAVERQLALIEAQQRELVALASPVVEVWEGVVVMPVIGRMDEARARDMTERLLATVAARQTSLVILDLTSLAATDEGSAAQMTRMSQAVRLLGCRMVLTGLPSASAMIVANLGIDLGRLEAFGSIRQALDAALKQRGERSLR